MSEPKPRVSAEIEALLREDRVFTPSDEFRAQAIVNDPDVYRRAAADPEAFWMERARELEWITPFSKGLEWTPSICQVVCRRHAECQRQLSRSTPWDVAAQQGGVHLGR